jgi:hypothetical protein
MVEILRVMSIQIVGLCVTTLLCLIGSYHVADYKKRQKLIYALAGIRTAELVHE